MQHTLPIPIRVAGGFARAENLFHQSEISLGDGQNGIWRSCSTPKNVAIHANIQHSDLRPHGCCREVDTSTNATVIYWLEQLLDPTVDWNNDPLHRLNCLANSLF